LVKLGKTCPQALRAIVVGGGGLKSNLYHKARELGYPVLPSYGLTECASQVATAHMNSLESTNYPLMPLLAHVKAKVDLNGVLHIQSPSLLTGYVDLLDGGQRLSEFTDPKDKGWYMTNDYVFLNDNTIEKVLGRTTDVVKVSGELVHLDYLQEVWDNLADNQTAVVLAVPDERREHNIVLVLPGTPCPHTDDKIKLFKNSVVNVAKISGVYYVDDLPQTELGKVKRKEVLKLLGFLKDFAE
jgi:O-succinylbenzoic acid--CoA ligase